jgi:hypothetical protein
MVIFGGFVLGMVFLDLAFSIFVTCIFLYPIRNALVERDAFTGNRQVLVEKKKTKRKDPSFSPCPVL